MEFPEDGALRTGDYHFELLERRHNRSSIYSKRISQSNRVVYSIDVKNNLVTIFSAWGRYTSGVHALDQHFCKG